MSWLFWGSEEECSLLYSVGNEGPQFLTLPRSSSNTSLTTEIRRSMYVIGPRKVSKYTVLWTVKPIIQSCMMLASHAPVNHSSQSNHGSSITTVAHKKEVTRCRWALDWAESWDLVAGIKIPFFSFWFYYNKMKEYVLPRAQKTSTALLHYLLWSFQIHIPPLNPHPDTHLVSTNGIPDDTAWKLEVKGKWPQGI